MYKLSFSESNAKVCTLMCHQVGGDGARAPPTGKERCFTCSHFPFHTISTRSEQCWQSSLKWLIRSSEISTERGVGRRRRPPSTEKTSTLTSPPPRSMTSPPPRSRSSTLTSLTTPSADRRPRGRGGGISWSIPAGGGGGDFCLEF